jgi:mannose-6-phosphate isomerase-like protein (cupin superfamily)
MIAGGFMTAHACSSIALLLATVSAAGAQQPAPRSPTAAAAQGPRASSVAVSVTDPSGAPVQGVRITVTGPVTRSVTTVASGTARLLGMRSGTYRLRFEHDRFITLERDVTMRAGAVPGIDVTLSPAPEAPSPAPAPPPAPSSPASGRDSAPPGEPRHLAIVDFLDKHLISGREPAKQDEVGCTATARTTLLQLREPTKEQAREDADEVLYVIAGEGTLRLGNRDLPLASSTVAVVPRGTARALTRKGRNPLIVLSVVSGPACTQE